MTLYRLMVNCDGGKKMRNLMMGDGLMCARAKSPVVLASCVCVEVCALPNSKERIVFF